MKGNSNYLSQAARNRSELARVKKLYVSGLISREYAKKLAQPILDRVNQATIEKTKELNKKYNTSRKPSLLDFTNAMRNSY